MKFLKQSGALLISFLLSFVWRSTLLSNYTVPTIGLLVFAYLLLSAKHKGKDFFALGGNNIWGIFLLSTTLLLLIFSTGGLNSSLFFVLYFLLFGIAFVFEPKVVFIFATGVLLTFLPQALQGNSSSLFSSTGNDVLGNLVKLGSVLLLSPLAFFFGLEYRKSEKEEEKILTLEEREKKAADTIAKDVEKVIASEKKNLKSSDIEKLNEILEKAELLRRDSE